MNERTTRNQFAGEPLAAATCFAGAVLSLATGFVLTTGWLLNANIHPLLHGVGIVLLILGIPILILGGHFMDLRDKKILESESHLHDNKVVHLLLGMLTFLSVFWSIPSM